MRQFFHLWCVGLVVALAALPADAAIQEGPTLTNTTAAEQRRIADFYHAQRSLEEQRQAGQKRYNEKQDLKAKVIASLNAQLKAREKTVSVEAPLAWKSSDSAPLPPSREWMGVAALAGLFAGIVYVWNRPRPRSAMLPPTTPDLLPRGLEPTSKGPAKARA